MQSTVDPLLDKICNQDVDSTLGSVGGIRNLPKYLQTQIIEAYAHGFRNAWISMLPFAVIGLLTCLALKTIAFHTGVDEEYYALADQHRTMNTDRVMEEPCEKSSSSAALSAVDEEKASPPQ